MIETDALVKRLGAVKATLHKIGWTYASAGLHLYADGTWQGAAANAVLNHFSTRYYPTPEEALGELETIAAKEAAKHG